jgi:hypothetical protein
MVQARPDHWKAGFVSGFQMVWLSNGRDWHKIEFESRTWFGFRMLTVIKIRTIRPVFELGIYRHLKTGTQKGRFSNVSDSGPSGIQVPTVFYKVFSSSRIQTTISNDDSNLEKSKLTNGDAASAELGDIANVYGDNVNGNNDKKKKKKKKKNSSNEALKKKKERKMFELEGQFEGQEMPSFAGILLNDNMNFAATNGEVQF